MFGERWGNWLIAPFQWSVLVGLAITYTATAGQSLQAGPPHCTLNTTSSPTLQLPLAEHVPQQACMHHMLGESMDPDAWSCRDVHLSFYNRTIQQLDSSSR